MIEDSLEQNISEPLNFVLNELSLPLMDKADELLESTQKLSPIEERILEDLLRTLLGLRHRSISQYNEQLQLLMLEAQENGDNRIKDFAHAMRQNAQLIHQMNRALERYKTRA